MIATDFHLIPLAELCKHEKTVLDRLDSVPTHYTECLLEEPELRYPFLYYALLTHWPELLGELSEEDLFYNRFYWYLRMSKLYELEHDIKGGYEEETELLLEYAETEADSERVRDIERRIQCGIASNEWEIAVAYSHFTIPSVKQQFGIQLDETGDYFSSVAPIAVRSLLVDTLKSSLPLALKINTEKARGEMIVAPILLEVFSQLEEKINFFSGVEWDVDPAQGLRGRCDFLMGLSTEQYAIEAPVLAIVEVKNDDIPAGMAQCIAEMVAARIFNRQNNTEIPVIYGVVTTGSNWRFLRLIDSTAYIDASEYHIKEVERIVGIIVSMFKSSGVTIESKLSPP